MSDKISPLDFKYASVDPDPGFSAEHNRRVIQETIDANNKLRAKKQRDFANEVKGRTGAIAQYFNDSVQGKTSSTAKEYFGTKMISRLRGFEIEKEIHQRLGKKLQQQVINKSKHPDFVVN